MKKPPTLTKLKAEYWKHFSLYIKRKYAIDEDTCRCYTCDAIIKIGTSNCQGGHYYTKKGYPGLYFDENNVRPQCYHCNINLSGNTIIFGERLENEIGTDAMEELKNKRHSSVKLTKNDYLELIKEIKQK